MDYRTRINPPCITRSFNEKRFMTYHRDEFTLLYESFLILKAIFLNMPLFIIEETFVISPCLFIGIFLCFFTLRVVSPFLAFFLV
jgi:hypothetical protein